MIAVPAHAKYRIIQEMMQREGNILNITWLCDSADVSRSGYYHFLATEELRLQSEEHDRKDFELIVKAYQYRGYQKGARGIYMRLLHLNPPVNMNLKKIRRLMRKYGLRCPIRKANPYRRMAKAIETAAISPNLLNREFECRGPRKVLLTDITYIINGKAPRCYMATFIDACTKELLAWTLSKSLEVDFVLEAVNQLIDKHGISLTAETLVHSDQGVHYKSVKFVQLVKEGDLRQSMSRKANCWDNAPQESFFGHMKDEIDITGCKTYREIRNVISDWTDYYNNDRYQWDLAKLSPVQSYQYLLTGVYPLSIPKPKGGD
jgi:transposase InsO family protein